MVDPRVVGVKLDWLWDEMKLKNEWERTGGEREQCWTSRFSSLSHICLRCRVLGRLHKLAEADERGADGKEQGRA